MSVVYYLILRTAVSATVPDRKNLNDAEGMRCACGTYKPKAAPPRAPGA